MARFAFLVVASPLHDVDAVEAIVAPVADRLVECGGVRVATGLDRPDRPLVLVVATGGTEAAILAVAAQRSDLTPRAPVILVSHGLHNSLPASLEALARLRRDGHRGRIVQIDAPGEPETSLTDLDAIHRLQGARLGLVGTPSEWLVASVPDRDALRDRWGISLVDVDVDEPVRHHRESSDEQSRVVALAFSPDGPPADDLLAAAALHPALTASIERHRLDAVTVRCFDFLSDLHTSGCVALAALNDAGVVAGCEGDVASAVAMMLVRELLGAPAWIANPSAVNPDAGRLLLAHCTVAPSMVTDVTVTTHFESGLGIGLRGSFPVDAWVTLLRLGGTALERCWLAEARIVASGDSPDLCRTQVTLEVTGDRLTELIDDPLGNHVVLVHGRHESRLRRWLRLAHG